MVNRIQPAGDAADAAAGVRRRSEERLRLVIEATSDGIWDWNLQAGEMFFSDRWYTMLDYAPGEFPATYASWRERLHPDDRAPAEAAVQAHLEGCLPEYSIECRMQAKRGDWRWVNARGKVIERDAAGRPLRMVGTHVDIDARKRTEKALRLAQLSISRASDAVFWIAPNGYFVEVNEQACSSLGFTRDELLSMAVWEIDPDFAAERWPPHWEQTRQLGKRRIETRHRRRDGTIFPVEVIANHVEYEGEEYDFAFVRDVSERKRAETALRESEARLRTAIESIPFDLFLIDVGGRYVLQNSASREHWGDVSGKRPAEVTDDQALLAHWQSNNARALAGEIVGEDVCLGVGDAQRHIHNVIAPIRDGDAICGIVGVNIDITERKRVEAELQRYREHLEDVVRERTTALARSNADLRQAMEHLVQTEKLAALGHLVAGVAHELNTPLGNARLVAGTLGELLREFAVTVESGSVRRSQVTTFLARGREAVELLERNAERAADLITQFKQVAVDQSSARRRSFDLRQTVDEMLTTLRPVLKGLRHQIEVDVPGGLELDSYPGPLEQVLVNLVGNSLAHGFAGIEAGRIELKAQTLDAQRVRLTYSDNGVGIPAANLTRIFDPFFTTRLGQGGSGLGLYIVYNVVTGVLGGSIKVDSAPGHGTLFTLTLPRTAPERLSPATR